jgi:hypothetical protein
LGPKVLPVQLRGPLVKDPHAVRVLDCVLAEPPAVLRLMELIENILKKAPEARDTLPAPGQPAFNFEASSGPEGDPQVRLWINDREVPLKRWADIHRLLAELCRDRKGQFSASAMKKRGVTNPSQAVREVRKALDQTYPGADRWLLTDPIRWKDGHAPKERFEQPG